VASEFDGGVEESELPIFFGRKWRRASVLKGLEYSFFGAGQGVDVLRKERRLYGLKAD